MKKNISNFTNKLFFKKWIVGICQENIKDVIRNKTFNPDIRWLRIESFDKFHADPFLLRSKIGDLQILLEDYSFSDDYGKLSLMTLDEDFRLKGQKIVLDTRSHLSYPFIFIENNKTYVFPETAQKGKLSCYEYNYESESLEFLQDILCLPLRDSTILKHNNKYWIFGTMSDNGAEYKLDVYTSDRLLGPYTPHRANPIKSGLNGTRSAGNFIQIDGAVYRPSQNCLNNYGESITINKITKLDEISIEEEPYMTIELNSQQKCNHDVHSIHTINILDDLIVVDGEQWIFSPINQLKSFLKNRTKRMFK